jgi:hypothetical protein
MGVSVMTDPKTQSLIDELATLLADATGIPETDLRDRLLARAEYVALPSSQAAIAKAEAKRQRKAERLRKQQGEQS